MSGRKVPSGKYAEHSSRDDGGLGIHFAKRGLGSWRSTMFIVCTIYITQSGWTLIT